MRLLPGSSARRLGGLGYAPVALSEVLRECDPGDLDADGVGCSEGPADCAEGAALLGDGRPARGPARRHDVLLGVLSSALLGGASCYRALSRDAGPAEPRGARLRAQVGAPLGFAAHNGDSSVHGFHGLCDQAEVDVDYWTRRDTLYAVGDVPAAEACRTRCFEEGNCMVWSWGDPAAGAGLANNCYLKTLEQSEHPIGKHKVGIVSGALPCNMGVLGTYQSLFCFSLVMPSGYEQRLLKMQHDRDISIFKCDDVAIYSNESLEVAPGVQAHVIDSDLKCEKGGEFGTALNLEIFMAVWKQVLTDGQYDQHMWTVKVDADAVFFPDRLRAVLPHHREREGGVYLNNCKFGMHGPLEVFSKNAVHTWSEGMQSCVDHFFEVCNGDCNWGEDMFIDQCMGKFLKCDREDDWTLLAEDHCSPNPQHQDEWKTCTGGQASFHPFKTEEGYLDCMAAAQGLPPEEHPPAPHEEPPREDPGAPPPPAAGDGPPADEEPPPAPEAEDSAVDAPVEAGPPAGGPPDAPEAEGSPAGAPVDAGGPPDAPEAEDSAADAPVDDGPPAGGPPGAPEAEGSPASAPVDDGPAGPPDAPEAEDAAPDRPPAGGLPDAPPAEDAPDAPAVLASPADAPDAPEVATTPAPQASAEQDAALSTTTTTAAPTTTSDDVEGPSTTATTTSDDVKSPTTESPPRNSSGSGARKKSAQVSVRKEMDVGIFTECPAPEVDVDLDPDNASSLSLDHIPSWEMCCAFCHGIPDCRAWVWKLDPVLEGCQYRCWVLSRAPDRNASSAKVVGTVSGVPPPRLPLQHGGPPEAPPDRAMLRSGGRLHGAARRRPSDNISLFCFALVLPTGYERKFIGMQRDLNTSIFACDRAAVYSNVSFDFAPGQNTSVVNTSLSCERGGDSYTALNSWVFIEVWRRVISDGWFSEYEWTVKVDADAVFFPHRLRAVLSDHPEAGYISNCGYGMHGPVEVLSRAAMLVLSDDYADSEDQRSPSRCVDELHFGLWGEDMFLDNCLSQVHNVSRVVDARLLCEGACDCPDWFWCNSGDDRVSYHPFKREDMYRQCVANALGSARVHAAAED